MVTVPPGLRRAALDGFRRLPFPVRQRLVRLGTANYTAGAVVLVRDGTGRLLLVRQPPLAGWALPGGLLKRRERPIVGAARELAEEVGIRVPPGNLSEMAPSAVVNPATQQVDLVFTTTVDADVVLTVDGVEIGEAAWFDIDGMPPLTGPTARLLARYDLG
jgi:8-oxo-dGTP pyrophosphatase MutT (NUDIX family)